MSRLPLRTWMMASITLALAAVVVRLVWELIPLTSTGTLAVIIPLILVIIGIYTLLFYLTINPSPKKLKSLPVLTGITVIVTAALISGIIHFIRFVPSPEAASPLSVIIASLLLVSGTSAYLLVMRVIWSIWKAGKS
ncbi:hypothetical protein ACFLUD_03090 [Chloroflexota bacterium]